MKYFKKIAVSYAITPFKVKDKDEYFSAKGYAKEKANSALSGAASAPIGMAAGAFLGGLAGGAPGAVAGTIAGGAIAGAGGAAKAQKKTEQDAGNPAPKGHAGRRLAASLAYGAPGAALATYGKFTGNKALQYGGTAAAIGGGILGDVLVRNYDR